MKTMPRWLLPFTWGVDMQAIDAVVQLAASQNATLIALSLLPKTAGRSSGHAARQSVRAELRQQSQDFLEAVRWKSRRYQVRAEAYEAITRDPMTSIVASARQLECERIILVSRGHSETLLHACEVKALLRKQPVPLLLLYFPEREKVFRPAQAMRSWAERLRSRLALASLAR
jgi:hypothetical protein